MVRLKASIKISPVEKVRDLAVKAAFRSQSMGNSLYTPEYNLDNISTYQVGDAGISQTLSACSIYKLDYC